MSSLAKIYHYCHGDCVDLYLMKYHRWHVIYAIALYCRTKFALMESLPLPLGVTPPSGSNSGSSKADVVLGGGVDGWSGLSQGVNYYADTMGQLVKGDSYKGREAGQEFSYVVDAASDKIVAQDGRVGYAAAADTLFVHT